MRTKHLVTILVLLMLVVPASPAHAGGIVSVCDEAHLLAALAGGGTVTFTCSGTITLTAEITIAVDTTIDGSGQTVTISGNNAVRVFTVNEGVTLNLNELTIADGAAPGYEFGGGIYNSGTVTVSNSIFSGNSAGELGDGGGIYNFGTLTVSNSIFSGNSAWMGGGIITIIGTLNVSNSTFFGNRAISGGGIYSQSGMIVSNSAFTGNSGGGIALSGASIVSNSTFSGNSATGNGGGIDSYIGRLTVSNSTFSDNSATGNGGGIYNSYNATLTVTNNVFSYNSAGQTGGGIANAGTLIVSNSTFSGNSASAGGGGIYQKDWVGEVTVSNSTFWGNSADVGGGINNDYSGTVIMKNTIVANSPSGGNCTGTITDGGGNLSYPDTTCPGINADPLLGPLQNNGGPTETMALGPGSAAIDAANDAICAAAPVNNLDQRGVTRPQGPHCDIGAVEQIQEPAAVSLSVLSAQSLPGTIPSPIIAGLLLATLMGVSARQRR